MTNKAAITCSCTCGQSQVQLAKAPMLRFHCHCTICQNLYKKPYSDVTVMWGNNANLSSDQYIEYRRPGLLLKRGICTQCEQPIFATMTLLPSLLSWSGLKLVFIPANRYQDTSLLPEASAHIFFHRSEVQVNDGIVKTQGFIKSEIMISWLIIKSAWLQFFKRV